MTKTYYRILTLLTLLVLALPLCADDNIFYYDPNITTDDGDGSDWKNAIHSKLQDAIDKAAEYHINHTDKTAYVYAKGNSNKTEESITLRNGVVVVGSICQDGTIPGLLCPSTQRTIVQGLSTETDETYNAPTSIDNIYVNGNMNVSATAKSTDPTANMLLRNIVVTGTVNLQGAVAYNSLFLSETESPTIAANAYAIHCTSEKEFSASNSENIKFCNATVFANLSWQTFPALNYQLPHNDATCIDKGNAAFFDPFNGSLSLIHDISFPTDRDLLGNSRMIGDKADCGAFEAWIVKAGTNVTARSKDGSKSVNEYPHEGTNITIKPGANLILDASLSGISFRPGYLHVMQGGSLFSGGNEIQLANVAVSRMIRKEGSVVSLPFPHDYSNDGGTAYRYNGTKRSKHGYDFFSSNSPCWEMVANGTVIPANEGVMFVPNSSGWTTDDEHEFVFKTCGESPSNYIYSETANELYKTVTLNQFKETEKTGPAHYTTKEDMGWNCIGLPYLVSNYKTSEKVNPENGRAWNKEANEYATAPYRMNLPHTLWLYYDGVYDATGNTTADGNGGFYSVNSWESSDATTNEQLSDGTHTNPWHVNTLAEQCIWTGEGFFVQTATLSSKEVVKFYKPEDTSAVLSIGEDDSDVDVVVDSRPRHSKRIYVTGITNPTTADSDHANAEIIGTDYYTTDGIHLAAPLPHGITIIRHRYSDGTTNIRKVSNPL